LVWNRGYYISDKIALLLAVFSIPLWYLTGNPLLSVVLLMIVDVFSSYPTIRKTINDPYSENLPAFIVEFVGINFSILALSHINFISA